MSRVLPEPLSVPLSQSMQAIQHYIDKTRAEERERCAKIVESGICDGLSWEDKALQKAADDIRRGESRYGLRR